MRITEAQLRRIIRQEVRSLRESAQGILDAQTEANIDTVLSWMLERLEQVFSLALGEPVPDEKITDDQSAAALDEAIASMQGLGMVPEEIAGHVENRAIKKGFRKDDSRRIAELVIRHIEDPAGY